MEHAKHGRYKSKYTNTPVKAAAFIMHDPRNGAAVGLFGARFFFRRMGQRAADGDVLEYLENRVVRLEEMIKRLEGGEFVFIGGRVPTKEGMAAKIKRLHEAAADCCGHVAMMRRNRASALSSAAGKAPEMQEKAALEMRAAAEHSERAAGHFEKAGMGDRAARQWETAAEYWGSLGALKLELDAYGRAATAFKAEDRVADAARCEKAIRHRQ
ncbi:Uncharacterised protein [uncultured archaeon]|nr:Uncharacterised protein [uncultured archaeon]